MHSFESLFRTAENRSAIIRMDDRLGFVDSVQTRFAEAIGIVSQRSPPGTSEDPTNPKINSLPSDRIAPPLSEAKGQDRHDPSLVNNQQGSSGQRRHLEMGE
ncbi:hypothetical protein HZ994_11285 [Akkermansiaceae bacterium]|nr:hypothetical protein HZ994_11285 [Akkermansiaceae bacterium]